MGKSKPNRHDFYLQEQKRIADIKRRDQERAREIRDKIDTVTNMVKKAALEGSLESTKFNVLEVNFFARIDECNMYVPAEISVAEFSLKEGVVNMYHSFPRPGTIPLGYKRECMENSNKSHRIPLEKENMIGTTVDEKVEFRLKSDSQIFQDIATQLGECKVVFCMPEKQAECEGVLRTISTRSTLDMPVTKILPLPELFYQLANSSQRGEMIPSVGFAEGELERERFLYKSGLSCAWHENMTETFSCSSATTYRLCYTVLDLCCQYYNIILMPGKHMPRSVEIRSLEEEDWDYNCINVRPISNTGQKNIDAAGEFTSKDIRLLTGEKRENKLKAVTEAPEKTKYNCVQKNHQDSNNNSSRDITHHGTISDYLGAVTESVSILSLTTDCSSDTEFIAMDSVSKVGAYKENVASVVVKGVGRGKVLPGRRFSRIAANFHGLEK